MPLDDFFRKIIVIDEFDIEEESIRIINENHKFIEDLVRFQMSKGKDGKGENVTILGRDYYKDATVFNKEHSGFGLGKETNFITNYMSGSFYTSLRTLASGKTFDTYSEVSYFKDIIKRSGSIILELDEKSLEKFSEEILFPQIQISFTKKFNGV